MRLHFISTLVLLALSLTGCAGYAPHDALIGQDRKAVIDYMGVPTKERAVAGGTRLDYAKGPFGKQTYFVTLNAQGLVTGWQEVLNDANFEKLRPGMTRDEVEFVIGPTTRFYNSGPGESKVWTYSYSNSICQTFQVEFGPDGLVKALGHGYAPECGNSY